MQIFSCIHMTICPVNMWTITHLTLKTTASTPKTVFQLKYVIADLYEAYFQDSCNCSLGSQHIKYQVYMTLYVGIQFVFYLGNLKKVIIK